MRIHVVGVSGTGMGALAGLLLELGHEVSGSDVAFDPPMGPALESWGVRCLRGFDPAHLEPAPELVGVGNVCRRDNPEAVAAHERGLEVTHIAGALARFVLEGSSPLVVAGTHGKTTTTALATWLLERAGLEPGFLVGGLPRAGDRSFRAPARRQRLAALGGAMRRAPFVIEGDEYDTAYFEKTAKFLHYRPEVAIVTSVEHDHVDIYPTLESYLEAFRRFVALVPESGLVVACAQEPLVVKIVGEAARAQVAWYALEGEDTHGMPPHWLAAPAATAGGVQTFDLYAGGVSCGRLALPIPGRHNVLNATAAIAAVTQGFGVRLTDAAPALASFPGVRRRQELLGAPAGVAVYDDFAHHPTAVRETLAALASRHPEARLLVAFEPRSATACRRLHQEAYAAAFDGAAGVYLAPLGRTNLPPAEALDLGRLVSDLTDRGRAARACGSLDELVSAIVGEARPGDVIALLSNGAFGGVHARVLSALQAREPPG
ncbi:MAG: UDP-N-acetylmuramate:L-alanyl-gamma-D-glutamyl-meso-diaminopimelate ligase [Polyangiaceae bacterium]|nr:UDP-N-acetylmuramate:L-alanyl-gamma-D-glutamyl-meso-diaminopimelate ligase [Polyangiaceae bacterium]